MTIYQEQQKRLDAKLNLLAIGEFSDADLNRLFDNSLSAIAFVYRDGRIQWCNQLWSDHKALFHQEDIGQSICAELKDMSGNPLMVKGFLRQEIFDQKGVITSYLKAKVDGTNYSFLTRIISTDKSPSRLCIIQAQDISKLVRLSSVNQLFQGLFQSSAEAVIITNSKGTILLANSAIREIIGQDPESLIHTKIFDIQSRKHKNNFYGRVVDELRYQDFWEGTICFQHIDGSSVAERVAVTKVGKGAANTQYISIIRHRPKTSSLLSIDDSLEPVSQLGYPTKKELALNLEARIDSGDPFILFCVLLKQEEKALLQTKGGSQPILIQMLNNLRKSLTNCAYISIISGREFAIVTETLDQTALQSRAQRIKEVLSSKVYAAGPNKLHINAQIGVVISGNVYRSAADYLEAAQEAAADAHQESFKAIKIVDPAEARKKKGMNGLSIKLRRAIRNGEIYPVYEPFVDLASDKVVGCEALVRWKSPELGELSPGEFLPVAVAHGMIEDLTEIMFYRACCDAYGWIEDGLNLKILSLNVTARDVDKDYLPGLIDKTLRSSKLDPKYLQVEITEEGLIDKERAIEVLSKIRETGVRIAIDDFGTGYSSLSYLKDLPVDALKIDRSFVSGFTRNSGDLAIVETVNFLGQKLGLKTIAEGIESGDQKSVLKAMGCDFGQGFLFSKGKKAEQFKKLLDRR